MFTGWGRSSEPRGNNVPSSPPSMSMCRLQCFLFFHLSHLSIVYYFLLSDCLLIFNYVRLFFLASFSCHLSASSIPGHIYTVACQ